MSIQSSPMSGLPDELVEEILARVPATSLKRLRSTCKNWNTLFDDRRFTKKHKAEREYLDLMFRNNYRRLSWMSVNLHGLNDKTDPSAIECKNLLSSKKIFNNSEFFDVFHCRGFLLCTNTSTTVVWNPCTGQTRRILTKNVNTWDHEYALGYVNHDYKILRFLNGETFELEIFEFNSYSWRVSGTVNKDFILHGRGVSVKGNTYWIAYDNDLYSSCFVISFDFTTERFGPRVCLPFQSYYYTRTILLYSVREERLSVLFDDKDAFKTEIWMTNDITETMSWSKFLNIGLNFTRQLWFPVSFSIDEENKFAVVFHEDEFGDHRVYIIGEDKWRAENLAPRNAFGPNLFSYVPSLVQI